VAVSHPAAHRAATAPSHSAAALAVSAHQYPAGRKTSGFTTNTWTHADSHALERAAVGAALSVAGGAASSRGDPMRSTSHAAFAHPAARAARATPLPETQAGVAGPSGFAREPGLHTSPNAPLVSRSDPAAQGMRGMHPTVHRLQMRAAVGGKIV
jgi:hypothetical protein